MGNAVQGAPGLHHGVGAMGNNNLIAGTGQHPLANYLPIRFSHVETVFTHHFDDVQFQLQVRFCQKFAQGGIANLEAAFGVEVNFIDGAAGGKNFDHFFIPLAILCRYTGQRVPACL